ncbi:MgtC/SapB family protein [Planococcus shenhongbingii]|uniref:MgtC/SapB family protein n=1 Tax=Planococcus shenhongbingii TaxID=3058398 RepID=A0ABT8NH36_9BACL|nr:MULTISPECIES: MgtC/SapB family protein [unclassified Planococcus (in: firmicutes)]MDN7247194.1 MgtC/SapB family protein [Planococcus sp. N017]WKA59781.1 MgtC/SapB family protein [Planococcus sp. N016]
MDLFSSLEVFSLETFLKLFLAALLSLIIGLERELKRKPVGLKTSIVIATFSCLLTIISIESAYIAKGSEHDNVNITMDPLRLAAQIVSGIGFLGAGVILKRGNDSISGLTTAAMIWGAGGIGIAVAAGFYIEAAVSVLIILIGIELVPPLLFKYGPKRLQMIEAIIKIIVTEKNSIASIVEDIKKVGVVIETLSISDQQEKGEPQKHELIMRTSFSQDKQTLFLYQTIGSIDYVEQVTIELIN